MIDSRLKDMRLIPLRPYTKIASKAWGGDENLTIPDNATGYGVDCGKSGLVVIDCDVKEEVNGMTNFLNWYNEHDNMPMPETMMVQTPSGGLHVYYKTPPGVSIKTSAGTFLPGVDVRAMGGYIVGPGSVIKDEDDNIGNYFSFDDAEIKELPDFLVKALASKAKVKTSTAKNATKTATSNTVEAPRKSVEEYEQKMMKEYALLQMSKSSEGHRNSDLNKLSYLMGRKRVQELEAKEITKVAVEVGLSSDEAEITFKSGYNAGLKEDLLDFDSITKQFNSTSTRSFLDDPYDVEYYSHSGLAGNFHRKYCENYLFWNADSRWYKYNEENGYWMVVNEDAVKEEIKDYIEELVEYNRKTCTKLSSAVYKVQEKVFSRNTVDNVVATAKLVFLNKNMNLFDSSPRLLNCKNGVVNLETGELLPHSKELYLSKYVPVNYNKEATDVYCDKVLESIHPEQKEFLRIISGQALVGEQPISQTVFFLHGNGSNGKSTFIDLMLKTSGDYGRLQPPSVLADEKQGGDKYALADFEGLRNVVIEELADSKHLNSSSLKRIVGTQRINSRRIYGSYKEFDNNSTVFVSCNRLPIVTDTDEGTWRRLTVVSFPYSYRPSKALCTGPMDKLGDPMVILSANRNPKTAEAFLAWRVSGAVDWCKNFNLENNVPQSVKDKVEAWREANDLIRGWWNQNINYSNDTYVTVNDLYKSYTEWAAERGQNKISQRTFVDSLTNHELFLRGYSTFYRYNLKPRKNFSRSKPRLKNEEFKDQINHGEKFAHIEGLKFKNN